MGVKGLFEDVIPFAFYELLFGAYCRRNAWRF